MLQAIRDRAQGIFAWVLVIVIGVPFALWGIQNYLGSEKEPPAATVGGRDIMDRDVSRAYEQSLASLIQGADYDEKELRRDALERLIMEEIVYQTADARSLAVSEAGVRSYIQALPDFQTEGKFDKDKYKRMLSQRGIAPDQFAARIRRSLLVFQLQKGILGSAFVTKDQVASLLRLQNQERTIEYVTVPAKATDRGFSDGELDAYYREHRADFRNPEKVSVEYLVLSLEDLAKDIRISEEELHQIYEEHRSTFGTGERRKISHILIPVESGKAGSDQAALAKITEIRDRLAKGEDFAKLAKEVSGDPLSAKNGGDLGFIDKASGLEESFMKAAEALKQGETSEPVKTSFGYHLIKLTEWVPEKIKSFDEVKDELRKTAQHDAAETKFYELGKVLTEQSYEHPDSLEPAAKSANLEIQRSGWFTRDSGEGIAEDPAVRAAAFGEEVLNGRNSDPIEVGDEKAVLIRIKEHQPPSDKPLTEVKEAIVAKLRETEARKEAAAQAGELLQKVQSGQALAEAAKAKGFDLVKPAAALRRTDEKLPSELVRAVFKLPRSPGGRPAAASITLENGDQIVYTVIAVNDGPPLPTESKERDTAQQFLSRVEGQRQFSAFLGRLRERADVRLKPGT